MDWFSSIPTSHGFEIYPARGGYMLRDTDKGNKWKVGHVFKTEAFADDFAWECFEFKHGRMLYSSWPKHETLVPSERFEVNGERYRSDHETLCVIRNLVPDAKTSGDGSAVQAVIALVRKAVKAHGEDSEKVREFLIANGISEKLAKGASEPVYGRRGIPSYVTTNNGADVRRIKARISKLESIAKLETKEITVGTVRIVQNIEANRLQLFFPGKPDAETIKDLKSSGFRWAPSEKAWQRHISNGASYEGKRIAREFAAHAETQE